MHIVHGVAFVAQKSAIPVRTAPKPPTNFSTTTHMPNSYYHNVSSGVRRVAQSHNDSMSDLKDAVFWAAVFPIPISDFHFPGPNAAMCSVHGLLYSSSLGARFLGNLHKLAWLILLLPVMAQAQESTAKSPWDPLKFFVGRWQGATQGEPGQGKGQREYEFVLGGKFLQVKNKIVYPPQEKNPKGETHEDLGLYSYDSRRKKLVLRQFHSEGFVNQYVEQGGATDGKTLLFISEGIENIPEGWGARETYKIVSQHEYTEVFELAPPQKEFSVYSESRGKRLQ